MDTYAARLARKSGCRMCVFWDATKLAEIGKVDKGLCHHGAPRTTADYRWPVTRINDWCSEWRPGED